VLQLLRDAYAARPDLWQAWSVLINQLIDLGQHDEAHPLAKNATQRFPLLPRLWVDLARAEQARLNNPGETDALEKALEISPGYATASRQLATIYDRTHDLAKARQILEEAIAYNPLDVVNYGCFAHILYLAAQLEPAIARLQHAIRLDPGYSWAWSSLRQWQQELPEPKDLALELAQELTHTRAGEARSWLILANSIDPEKNSAELFAALDQALKLNPRTEEAYDTRARALARLDRFDEALAQCAPPVFLHTPPRLRLRAAWIEAQRGNLAGAIEKAKEALAEHPDYYAGWQLLADWQVQAGQIKDAVQAAEAMAGLAPLEPVPLGYLGDLKLRLQDRAGAAAAFQRAFTLDPHYEYAGFNLFDLQLEDRDFAAAEATLKILQRAGENPQTLAITVLLACQLKDWPRALDAFKGLCADSRTEHHPLDRAMRALDTAGQKKQADAAFDHALAQPNCNPVVGELWVDRMIARNRWRIHKRLAELQANQTLGRRVILRYLDHLGDAFQKARNNKDVTTPWRLHYHFKKILKAYDPWLSTDTESWGKVGYVLSCAGKPQPVINWLGDWRNRPKAESWMLYNLALMLQRARRFDEARDLIREAVTLRHTSDLYEYFRTHAAFEEALLGNADDARKHLAALPAGDHIRRDLRPLRAMTGILLGLDRPRSAEKDKRLANFKGAVKEAFDNVNPAKHPRIIREAYRRFALVADQKVPGAQFWTSWYYRGTDWLRIGLLILLVPTVFVAPPIGAVCLYFLIRERNRN
jgi:tetratricopeptide (TPR) repeat protein